MYYNTLKKSKRLLLRKRLIRVLFKNTLEKLNLSNINLKIIDNINKSSYANAVYNSYSDDIIEKNVYLNIGVFDDRIKNGYNNSYYDNRKEKLKKYSSNKHNLIRFIILHEIKHLIDRDNFPRIDFSDKKAKNQEFSPNRIFFETLADDFAIYHIENKTI